MMQVNVYPVPYDALFEDCADEPLCDGGYCETPWRAHPT